MYIRPHIDLSSFLGKSRKLERVNLAGRLEEIGLDQYFGSDSWPDVAPVREPATKIKSLTGEGFQNPFVFADMRK